MTKHRAGDSDALVLAAPAPGDSDEDDDDLAADGEQLDAEAHLHERCCAWAAWVCTRRLYTKPSLPISVLGKLTVRGTAGAPTGGRDAIASAELMAFHLAVLGQPADSLDRRVFELHYYWRVRNVKAAAAELGISRQHWYRLVRDFRARVFIASKEIFASNIAAADALPSRTA
jgi:hypothetical protein